MEHSANRTDRDKIVTAVVDALVKGESQGELVFRITDTL